jgi:integrase/recombinase XerD
MRSSVATRYQLGLVRQAGSVIDPPSASTPQGIVTTVLDAGVDLRDTQIAARHADPRTTMRYDRAGSNLDRHPNYILAGYMSAGT